MKVRLYNNGSTQSVTVTNFNYASPSWQQSNLINNTLNIGDQCFIPLLYGYKVGYFLGKSNNSFLYLEFTYDKLCLGRSKYTPVKGSFEYKQENLDIKYRVDSLMLEYKEAIINNANEFIFTGIV